jgi:tRNA nucleotidyltransferase (CCA-adding enzyme)
MRKNPKLIDKWFASLPRDLSRALSGIIATADASDASLYLVGGPVRDLLLGHPSLDIDLVHETDAIGLATRAAHYLDTTAKTHATFGTATIRIPARPEESKGRLTPAEPEASKAERVTGATIDIATARTETYSRPGALPKVQTPATIEQDLLRRDFTVNAIALHLNGPNRGELIDPCDGRTDLDARLIRIIHDRSFQDDPTRTLRALRYSHRLGFRVERHTRTRLKHDTVCLARVSGTRIHHELARIFEESAPETILRDLHRLEVLRTIHPAFRFEQPEATTFQRLRKLVDQGFTLTPSARAAYWPALALRLSPAQGPSLATRVAATNPQRAAIEAMPLLHSAIGTEHSALKRSALADFLAPYPPPTILALAAATSIRILRNRLLDYLTTARHIRPILRGDDLIALGIPEGPAIGDTLRKLRAAKIDGKIKTKTDEKRMARAINKVGDLNGGADVVGRRARQRGKREGGSMARPRRAPR